MGFVYWNLHSNVAGDAVHKMYQINVELGGFLVILGWWAQYLKRRVFHQARCMEENSSRWLSFLQAHPDPITIFNQESAMLFRNEDCKRILTPDLEGFEEHEELKLAQERVFGLKVDSFPKIVVLEGTEEDYEPEQ